MALQATVVKCPECGATLKVAEGEATATCTYCNTTARIQRRTQFLQMKMRLPPPQAHEPTRVAHQARSTGGKLVLAIILISGIGVPLAIVGALVAGKLGAFDSMSWDGMPLTADVDGDGTDDFIGWDRNTRTDTMKLVALSGRDGKVLWETAGLGTYDARQGIPIGTDGATVVSADKQLHLDAFDVKTGAKRWATTTTDAVYAICAVRAGLVIHTKDEKLWLASADGKLTPTSEPCEQQWTNEASGARVARRRKDKLDDMAIDNTFTRGDGPAIAIGRKHPGTAIPMVAALDGDRVLWESVVPGHDPRDVKHGGADRFAMSDDLVAIAYERDKGVPELTVFERATGKRKFEVPLDKTFFNVLTGVVIGKGAIAVATWGSLQVFDPATGERRWVVGG